MNEEEVTEKGVVSVTPEPNKPNSATRRNSTGKTNTTSPPYSNSDGIPHYLRASTGSCHDFCKYGRKHDFDAKKRHPNLPTFLESTGTINEEYNQMKVPAEKGVVSVTPEPNKPNSATRRYSTGKTNTTSPPFSISDGIPHYLRASTGSCHDFCKYGRKHDFDAKKRHPNLPTFLESTGTINDEYNQMKVPALQNRRKTSEISLKQPKTVVSSGRKAIKKGMSPAPDAPSTQTNVPDIPFTRVDVSSEDVSSTTSLEHRPASLDEGSSEEPVSIKLMVPPLFIALDDHEPTNQAGLLEEAIPLQLGTSSPTRKTAVSTEHIPLSFGSSVHTFASSIERSIEEPVNIELMTPSPYQESVASQSLVNQAERPYKKPITPKTNSSTSINIPAEHNFADIPEGPGERCISIKPQHPLPIPKSSMPAKRAPFSRAEKFSRESVISKLKSPSLVRKSYSTAEHTIGARAREASEKQETIRSLGLGDKKRQMTKLKSALKLEDVDSDIVKVIKQRKTDVSRHPDIIRRKTWSPVKKTTSLESIPTMQKSLQKTIALRTPKTIKQTASSPPISLTAGVKKSTSPLASSRGLNNQRNQENRIDRSAGMLQTGDKKVLKTPKVSLSPNPVNRVSSIKLRKYRSTLSASPLKSKIAGVKSTSPLVSSRGLTNQRNQNRITRSTSQIGDRKVLRTPKASLSSNPVNRVSSIKLRKYRSTLSASPLKSRAKARHQEHDTEIVKEKTLYVIETKQEKINLKHLRQKSTEYKSSLALPSSSSSSASSSSVSSHEKHKHNYFDSVSSEASVSKLENKGRSEKPVSVSKVDSKPRPRRTSTVGLEGKLPSPHKLKFRRGKVVNLQPENDGPRRLRFRPARALSENQNEVVRKIIEKRREVSVPDLTTSSEPPAVVLRHQDVQDRKDSQGLFNHVIEETASKLVETRKSKVKALVGAFETVISLQETK